MRKRGLVILVACFPVWAAAYWLNWLNEKPTTIGGWTLWSEPSDLTEGANWAALIGTTVAFGVLFVDFIVWLLRQGFNKSGSSSGLS
jgi:hypothetical protein